MSNLAEAKEAAQRLEDVLGTEEARFKLIAADLEAKLPNWLPALMKNSATAARYLLSLLEDKEAREVATQIVYERDDDPVDCIAAAIAAARAQGAAAERAKWVKDEKATQEFLAEQAAAAIRARQP